MTNIPTIYKEPLREHTLNFLLSSFLISPKRGFLNVFQAYIDPNTGSSLGKNVISAQGTDCILFNQVQVDHLPSEYQRGRSFVQSVNPLGPQRNVAQYRPKSFSVTELDTMSMARFPVGQTDPRYEAPTAENRKISGGTQWAGIRLDITSGAPNYTADLVTETLVISARMWITSALLRAIYEPVVATRDGSEKLVTYADDSQETVDFSKQSLGYKELTMGINRILCNSYNTGLTRDDYFLFLPSSIWDIVYGSNLDAPTRGQLQYQNGMWRTELGVNILVVPDHLIPVENGLFQAPFINRRALGAVIRKPGFKVPYGFSDILEYNSQRSEGLANLSNEIGGMSNLPLTLYGSDSVERLYNDAAIVVAFDFIAGRISRHGVYTFTFSAKNQKSSPAPSAPVYYMLPAETAKTPKAAKTPKTPEAAEAAGTLTTKE